MCVLSGPLERPYFSDEVTGPPGSDVDIVRVSTTTTTPPHPRLLLPKDNLTPGKVDVSTTLRKPIYFNLYNLFVSIFIHFAQVVSQISH